MKRQRRYSPLAIADLRSIARYSRDTFGKAQALNYVAMMETACNALADDQRWGTRYDHISPGLFRLKAGSHAIFYRQDNMNIVIVRILHGRMSAEDHL